MSAIPLPVQNQNWATRLAGYDWEQVTAESGREGVAVLPRLLSDAEAGAFSARFESLDASGRFGESLVEGRGQYRLLLPERWATAADGLYTYLAPIANGWQETLGQLTRFPFSPSQWHGRRESSDQQRTQAWISCLAAGQDEALSQVATCEQAFPLQVTILLSEPRRDFTGGEFVMVEQRPRMQSRPIVIPLRIGDAAILASHQRPVQGARGVYRSNLKHGVSPVRSGIRLALELVFHPTH